MSEKERTLDSSRRETFDIESRLKRALDGDPRLRAWFETSQESAKIVKRAHGSGSTDRPSPAVYSSTG